MEGILLRSIGCVNEGLIQPRGLCVHGQYLYVTEVSGHCVFVFTTNGEFVASFGQKGKKKGDFNRPVGIHVDRDGFVGVIDFYNDRIQFF